MAPAAVFTFFVLAFAWSWAFWWLAPLWKDDAPVTSTALALVGGFGPSLAAVAVVAYHGGCGGLRRWLSRCLQWRVGWHWMAGAFFFPVGFMGLAAAAHVALGGTLPPSPAAGHILLAAVNFGLVFLVGGPPGEESAGADTPCPLCSADGDGAAPVWFWVVRGRSGMCRSSTARVRCRATCRWGCMH